MYMTKEYFDSSLYMGGKIRSQSIKFANLKKFYLKSLIYFYFAIYHRPSRTPGSSLNYLPFESYALEVGNQTT